MWYRAVRIQVESCNPFGLRYQRMEFEVGGVTEIEGGSLRKDRGRNRHGNSNVLANS